VIFSMLTIKGIYGREMYETWYKMNVMLESGLDIRPIITHRLHHTEFVEGVRGDDSGQSGRVVLDWRRSSGEAPRRPDTWDDSCVLRHPLGMPRGRFVGGNTCVRGMDASTLQSGVRRSNLMAIGRTLAISLIVHGNVQDRSAGGLPAESDF